MGIECMKNKEQQYLLLIQLRLTKLNLRRQITFVFIYENVQLH